MGFVRRRCLPCTSRSTLQYFYFVLSLIWCALPNDPKKSGIRVTVWKKNIYKWMDQRRFFFSKNCMEVRWSPRWKRWSVVNVTTKRCAPVWEYSNAHVWQTQYTQISDNNTLFLWTIARGRREKVSGEEVKMYEEVMKRWWKVDEKLMKR